MNTKEKEITNKRKGFRRFSKPLIKLFSGNFLSQENVVSSLPYIFFLTFLGILYIANGYRAEKTIRNLNKMEDEVKELHSEYITIKSDLNFKSKQSQVAEATTKMGIKESTTPPTKIIIDKDDMEQLIGAN